MDARWCSVCCTNHAAGTECPGELLASGPEEPGWRVNVSTSRGIEAYGVLIAQCGDVWRARILTFPNVLWKAPGIDGTMKFVGGSSNEAVDHAIAFIRHHCHEKGYALRNARSLQTAMSVPGRSVAGRVLGPSPRKIRFLPIRFGSSQASEPGGTGNLSETGLYVITDSPFAPGDPLSLLLRLETDAIDLKGHVIWMTQQPRVGRPPGMGVVLATPPKHYLSYVRALP
jgi:hypothetical protein